MSPWGSSTSWGFTGDVRASAQALGAFVDRVRKATGSEKVDFVGHSQGGGILPNAYIKMYGGASKVDKLIGLVAANHGTTALGLDKLVDGLPEAVKDFLSTWSYDHNMEAYGQQLKGSALMQQVYRDGDTVPGIAYTVISTRLDTTVTPYTQAFLKGAKNMTVQDACPLDTYGHGRLPYDPVAYQMVLNALDPNHPREISCTWRPRVLPVSTTDAA
ncbi:triacylglycerol lipase precursor [Cutibacterium acnes JCM 18920]|nr:triacylglycerol lipase precursor [Cutibacterium acnes JCM 18920]